LNQDNNRGDRKYKIFSSNVNILFFTCNIYATDDIDHLQSSLADATDIERLEIHEGSPLSSSLLQPEIRHIKLKVKINTRIVILFNFSYLIYLNAREFCESLIIYQIYF